MSAIYTTTIQEDPNDPEGAILIIPEELLKEMGWTECTKLGIDFDDKTNSLVIKEAKTD